MSAIESVLVENRVFPPTDATVKAARISGMAAYEALSKEAESDFEGFWSRLARERPVSRKFFATRRDIARAFTLAEQRANFRADEVSPMAAAVHITVPALIIHGALDRKTPPDHSHVRKLF